MRASERFKDVSEDFRGCHGASVEFKEIVLGSKANDIRGFETLQM